VLFRTLQNVAITGVANPDYVKKLMIMNRLVVHREPVPLPEDQPFHEDVPHPVPQDEPIPDPHPELR
jgi:hypothetical protein